MSRSAFAARFSELVGRVGELPVGCEETEISIRLSQAGGRTLRGCGWTDARPATGPQR